MATGSDPRNLIAGVLQASGATGALGSVLNSRLLRGSLVRGVNYHETREADRASFRSHIEYYRRHFTILDAAQLAAFLDGALPLDRPGLLLTFDDGFKSQYAVAADALDQCGVKGFFFVPAGFIQDAHNTEAAKTFVTHRLYPGRVPGIWRDEDFMPMSWGDLRDLVRRGHSVGCHSMTHAPLGTDQDEQTLRREIVDAKAVIEQALGTAVSTFCWPFSTLSSYSKDAFILVRQHYGFGFTTFAAPLFVGGSRYAIDRSRVEASMPIARVRFGVQGGTELYLKGRRRQFEAIVELSADVSDS